VLASVDSLGRLQKKQTSLKNRKILNLLLFINRNK
jgi:hypothetical protein